MKLQALNSLKFNLNLQGNICRKGQLSAQTNPISINLNNNSSVLMNKQDISFGVQNRQKSIDEYEKILSRIGFEVKKDDDDLLILNSYYQPVVHFKDLGVDEDDMFKHIKKIKGDASFQDSDLTDLGALKSIGGNAYFRDSKIINLGNLESIGENAYFRNCELVSLGNLKSIGGNADFRNSNVADLGALESIGKDVYFEADKLTSLGNLKTVGGDIYLGEMKISMEMTQEIINKQ